ncbi:hypothetical protein BDW75DRAFT_212646 [Aspergillus navahoensis]
MLPRRTRKSFTGMAESMAAVDLLAGIKMVGFSLNTSLSRRDLCPIDQDASTILTYIIDFSDQSPLDWPSHRQYLQQPRPWPRPSLPRPSDLASASKSASTTSTATRYMITTSKAHTRLQQGGIIAMSFGEGDHRS